MLGEKVTTELSKNEKPNNFENSKKIAKRGGDVAGKSRKEAEKELGKSIRFSKKFFMKEGLFRKQVIFYQPQSFVNKWFDENFEICILEMKFRF